MATIGRPASRPQIKCPAWLSTVLEWRYPKPRILEAFKTREDIAHFAKLVPNGELAERDYLLSVPSHVEAKDTREAIDITVLNAEIARIVARQSELRSAIDGIVADLEGAS